MTYRLRPLSAEDCEQIRVWRLDCRESLRTPYMLTRSQQADFYQEVVSNRRAEARYFGVHPDGAEGLVGMVGLGPVQVENGLAEISLILDPEERGKGIGEAAVGLILEEGFDRMRLATIFGESYECSPALGFWEKVALGYGAELTWLPRRKFWAGQFWRALIFTITAEEWRKRR